MEEVLTLADRITVLRDGRYVGDLARAEATHDKIVAMMVGRRAQRALLPGQAATGRAAATAGAARSTDLLVPGRAGRRQLRRPPRRDPRLRRPGRRRGARS